MGTNEGVHSSEGYGPLYSSSTNIVILEEKHDEIHIPFRVEERLRGHLHELGYAYQLDENTKVGIPVSAIEILDVEYAVICANQPGLSQSGTIGYK